jgi:hypothetical protein
VSIDTTEKHEHYFVVKATMDSNGTIEFEIDGDTTLARFPEGFIWDGIKWIIPVEGERELVEDDIINRELVRRIYG